MQCSMELGWLKKINIDAEPRRNNETVGENNAAASFTAAVGAGQLNLLERFNRVETECSHCSARENNRPGQKGLSVTNSFGVSV
jgi:hypothetical protein